MELTDLQKRVYANQTLGMERAAVTRTAKVLAKARADLMKRVRQGRKSQHAADRTLASLELALRSLPKDLVESLEADKILEAGFNQGTTLVSEIARNTTAEGPIAGFTPILDLRTYSNERDKAVYDLRGVSDKLKAQLQEQAQVSLALGESETETMERLFSNRNRKAPFKTAAQGLERASRTITNSLTNTAKLGAYSSYRDRFPELGFKHEWLNVTDFRTSDLCEVLTGQVRNIGEPFSGGGWSGTSPPAHPNCRSTTIPVISKDTGTGSVPSPEPEAVGTDGLQVDWGLDLDRVEGEEEASTSKPMAEKRQVVWAEEPKDWAIEMVSELDLDSFLTTEYHQNLVELAINDGRNRAIDLVGPEVWGRLESISQNTRYQKAVEDVNRFNDALEPTEEDFEGYTSAIDDWEDLKHEVKRAMRDVITKLNSRHAVTEVLLHEDEVTALEYITVEFESDPGTQHRISLDPAMADRADKAEIIQLYAQTARFYGPQIFEDEVYGLNTLGYVTDRAYSHGGFINVGRPVDTATATRIALHELGHNYEKTRLSTNMLSQSFMRGKATSNQPERLSELTGNDNYREDEVAYPDHFVSPYVGKVYENGGTEVFSMGVENFRDSDTLSEFFINHPDHFYSTLTSLLTDHESYLRMGAQAIARPED